MEHALEALSKGVPFIVVVGCAIVTSAFATWNLKVGVVDVKLRAWLRRGCGAENGREKKELRRRKLCSWRMYVCFSQQRREKTVTDARDECVLEGCGCDSSIRLESCSVKLSNAKVRGLQKRRTLVRCGVWSRDINSISTATFVWLIQRLINPSTPLSFFHPQSRITTSLSARPIR